MVSGGNIVVRGSLELLLPVLLVPERLQVSLGLVAIVSDEYKLMPLSVFVLPHLLFFRMFESDMDFDDRIDDWLPDLQFTLTCCCS